jgi:transposase
MMRGADTFTESLFTMRKLEEFVPADHPLRAIRKMANAALEKMNVLFAGMYEADIKGGRPSVAPEKLLRAMLLLVLYSVRSERQLIEQVQYNLLFQWFVGLSMDDTVWVPTVFTKNRERLIKHDAVIEFFNEILAIAQQKAWLSGEHFSVDGTLIQARAGHKSFVRRDDDDQGNGDGSNFKGEKRSNDTHESKTDADARLYRKGGTASELRYMGHTLSDNRHGLVAYAVVTIADGYAEREAAKVMINDARQALNDPAREITLGADKGYDAHEFASLRGDEGHPACGAEPFRTPFGGTAGDCSERGLRRLAAKAQTDRTGIRLGQDGWEHASGDGARPEESGSDVCADDGGVQPGAHAHLGTNPCPGGAIS